MNILILGRGVSGIATKKLANILGFSSIIVEDGEKLPLLSNFDMAVVSPGVPPTSNLFQDIKKFPIEIISELEFGYRYFQGQILAVTGTNGKTTTTELTTELLNAVEKNAQSAGNIGRPLSDLVAENWNLPIHKKIIAVIEVSSFQLENTRDFSPFSALCLNISSDHLNRYDNSIQNYKNTKLKIFHKVAKDNCFYGKSMAEYSAKKFIIKQNKIFFNEKMLVNLSDLKLQGEHNYENILGALELVATILTNEEIFSNKFIDTLKSFHTKKHRIEKFYFNKNLCINDSKATNPASVIAALKTISDNPQQNIRIILGGLDKSMDFSILKDYCLYFKKCYLIGETKQILFNILSSEVACETFNNFFDCTEKIKSEIQDDDIVLLSPACASMDMFKNYAERGEQFIKSFTTTCE